MSSPGLRKEKPSSLFETIIICKINRKTKRFARIFSKGFFQEGPDIYILKTKLKKQNKKRRRL